MNAGRYEPGGLAEGVVGSARLIAFGASTIAPAGAVVAGMVVLVSYAGFASPLVVLIAFGASLCCASSIAEFARRLPSAGSLYTFNSRGLGQTGGFLTGWMMGREHALPSVLATLSSRRTPVVSIASVAVVALLLGLPLTYAYGGGHTFAYLAGAAGLSLVLIYLAVNIATIRAFRGEYREEFRIWRHVIVPAVAALLLLFPLWGILHPRTHRLVDLLPLASLAWLCLGLLAAGFLRAAVTQSLRDDGQGLRDDRGAAPGDLSAVRPAPVVTPPPSGKVARPKVK